MPRPIVATIDRAALSHNLDVARSLTTGARTWAVVKADAGVAPVVTKAAVKGPLAWCRKVKALVCKAEGDECDRWKADLAKWADFPPDAQETVEAGCREIYPRALADERERANWAKGAP